MKRIIFLLISISLMSCGSSKAVRESKKLINGNWILNTITYSKAGTYNVNLLNDASKMCFEDSAWQFVSNNNTGTYTINNHNCMIGERYFVFTIQEVDAVAGLYDILLKPTDKKHKSETNQGFRLRLANLSGNTMKWQQTLTVEGSPFTITMNFTKL